jgi:hypothetical protein
MAGASDASRMAKQAIQAPTHLYRLNLMSKFYHRPVENQRLYTLSTSDWRTICFTYVATAHVYCFSLEFADAFQHSWTAFIK